VRLAANADDAFVHWFADCDLPGRRCWLRLKAFSESAPERKLCGKWTTATNGAWRARLDTSHTCPDWESILALGPKGLADRARKRRETAKTDDERLFLDCVTEVYDALSRLCSLGGGRGKERNACVRRIPARDRGASAPHLARDAQLSLVYDRGQEAEGVCAFSRAFRPPLREVLSRRSRGRTRDAASAKALIADYFTRLYAQAIRNGRTSASAAMTRGRPRVNELTELAFELHDELNRPNPKLTYRFGKKTPRDSLRR
jgi:hypothetical protein